MNDEAEGARAEEEQERPVNPLDGKPATASRADGDPGGRDPAAQTIARLEQELLSTRERMLRIAAEHENYRKRAKKDADEAEHKARVDVLKEVLPVFDNLARAVEHAAAVKDAAPIIDGARMVARQFEENLAKFGLRRVESTGKFFDPSLHDAIAQEETEQAPPGTVIKEFLAGYTLGERLLRPAMVVVARAPQKK